MEGGRADWVRVLGVPNALRQSKPEPEGEGRRANYTPLPPDPQPHPTSPIPHPCLLFPHLLPMATPLPVTHLGPPFLSHFCTLRTVGHSWACFHRGPAPAWPRGGALTPTILPGEDGHENLFAGEQTLFS